MHTVWICEKKNSNKILLKKAQTYKKSNFGKHPTIRFYKKHNFASKLFFFNKETQEIFSLNQCSENKSVIASVCIFDTIAASLSNILIWTSTCGSVRYKRNIQNRKIQSKECWVLRSTHIGNLDHNEVTQEDVFVETAHQESKGVLILRTVSHHNTISCHNKKTDTTAQVYCTLSTYVIPKTISCQNQKLTQHHNCIVL